MLGGGVPTASHSTPLIDSQIGLWSWTINGTDDLIPDTYTSLADYTVAASESSFLRRMHTKGHRRACGLKHAENGRALASWWRSDPYFDNPLGGPGWLNLKLAVDKYLEITDTPTRFRGFIWFQGSGDSGAAGGSFSVFYGERLARLFADLKAYTATPDLKMALVLTPPASWTLQPGAAEVRAAQQAVADADPDNIVAVSAEDTAHVGDNVHFDRASKELLGVRLADAFLTLP